MSSNSSVCDSEDYYSYRALANMQEPWYDYYQTMGHPLVYYAKVQPSLRRNRSPRTKKGSPNFFVKAFRWYTQDHTPQPHQQEQAITGPDFSNFANWLDDKYGQFVEENQQLNYYNMVADQPPCSPCRYEPPPASHLRKRKSSVRKHDNNEKSCNSCEFIMQPKKEISITASEHLHGNIKAVSDTLRKKKSAAKSSSTIKTSSRIYDVDYQKSIDIVVTEGVANKNQEKCSCTKTEILTLYENKSKQDYMNDVSNKQFACDHADVQCQCNMPKAKIDAQTQYDENVNAPLKIHQPQKGAKTPKSGSNVTVSCNSCSNVPNAQAKHVTQKISSQKVPQVSDMSCQCILDCKSVTTRTASSRSFSCQCSIKCLTAPPSAAPIATPVAAPVTAPVVAPVAAPSLGPISPVPKSIDCVCTRSFQDAVKAICQQNITMVGHEKKEEEQIAVAPKVMSTVTSAPTATVTLSTPIIINAVQPSRVVVSKKTECCTHVSKVHETVQTSSHSICFDNEVKYPLFMRIVRADKLVI